MGESGITINSIEATLIASIQVDLNAQVLKQFQTELLGRLYHSRVDGVLLDLSGVGAMDVDDFNQLCKIITSAAVMGSQTVLVGLRPGIVCALVEMDADTQGLNTVASIEQGLALLSAMRGAS